MCSTPKGASTLRAKKRKRSEPEDYQAYAQMLRNASACYERNQALKAERKRLAQESAQHNPNETIPGKESRGISRNAGTRSAQIFGIALNAIRAT